MQKWVLDMATHFKSLDQQHLLTLGSEGEAGGSFEFPLQAAAPQAAALLFACQCSGSLWVRRLAC